jgi:predicted phage terminase large subunit-like protein
MASATATADPAEVADLLSLEAEWWELERADDSLADFGGWQKRHRREFDWSALHFDMMHDRLDAMTRGEIRRLLLQISVRHGKTETVTGYMAYRLDLDPSTRILLGTYSQLQAHKLSRAVRRLAKERGVQMSPDRDAVSEWETAEGGGLRAVGSGTGVASVNADLIVLDDPIGSRREAESKAHRDAVWDWITTDILARSEPHTQAIFSMPRWHHDDPAGRMQAQHGDRWEVIDLPGIAEEGDALGRDPGDLLWPSHRPQEWIDQMRLELGRYGFASAVQCRPSPREGGLFKWAWVEDRFVDAVPKSVKARVRYWDTAGTEDGGDYTAGVRVSQGTDGLFYVEDVRRGQWAPGHRDGQIQATCQADAKLGGAYEVGLEKDAGVGGEQRTQAIVRQLSGLKVFTERPTGSKESRADPVASQMEVGNVRIVRGEWNQPFLDELLSFPQGEHDDQVDALSGAFAALSKAPVRHARAPSPWG